MNTDDNLPAVPSTFSEYVRSFGPGIIVVLTWLGAGDIVEVSVAGGNFGYALMWVIVVAIFMRFLFVSLIAKYQLCNQHNEGVVDGLARLHPAYPRPVDCRSRHGPRLRGLHDRGHRRGEPEPHGDRADVAVGTVVERYRPGLCLQTGFWSC